MATYTSKLGNKICEHTATSSIGLRHICKQLGMPYSTVTGWIYDKKHELYEKYARAKTLQLYHIREEILEIADDSTNDYMTIVKNGKKVVVQNREAIARSRLRIQTRITLLTKLAPKPGRPDDENAKIDVRDTPLLIDVRQKKAPASATTLTNAKPPSRTSVTPPSPSLPRATVDGERSPKHPSSSPKKASKPAPVKLSENERLRAIYEEQLRSCVDNSATSQNRYLDNPMRGYTARVLAKK